MKRFLSFFLWCFCFISFSQSDSTFIPEDTTKILCNNTLTGMYIGNNNNELNLNFSGDNNIVKGNRWFSSNTTYSFAYNTKPLNNDLLQKFNVSYNQLFVSYIFNHSLTRDIKYDNLIGLGYIYRRKHLSLSYASMFENTIYNQIPTINVFRHSLRCKLKYEYKLFSLITEYYYQPSMFNLKDIIIYGTTKLIFLQNSKISFTITDIVNYRSINTIKLMHSISLGISYNLKIN